MLKNSSSICNKLPTEGGRRQEEEDYSQLEQKRERTVKLIHKPALCPDSTNQL
jgi:hypothetical protein